MDEKMTDRLELTERVGALPPRLRTAFAAASARRVLPIFGNWGDAEQLKSAIDAAWLFAGGMPPNPRGAESIFEEAVAAVPTPDELPEDRHGVVHAGIAACAALETIFHDSVASAVDAAERARQAVAVYDGEMGVVEERAWQSALLERLGEREAETAGHDIVKGVGEGPPTWYRRHATEAPLLRSGEP